MIADGNSLAENRRYTRVAVVMHWLIAGLLMFEGGLGLRMEAATGPVKFAVFQLHKSVGITILLLALMRLAWRVSHWPPPVGAHGWERALANAVHVLLYVLMLCVPLSGWSIISTSRIVVPTLLYGAIPWPSVPGLAGLDPGAKAMVNEVARSVHISLVLLIAALFVLHVVGAVKHHLLDDDGELARMLPGARPRRWAEPRLLGAVAVLAALMAGALQWLPLGPRRGALAAEPTGQPQLGHDVTPTVPRPVSSVASNGRPTALPTDLKPVIADQDPAVSATAPAVPEKLSDWSIASSSTIQFRVAWSGEPIKGGFRRFGGTITFDPEQLERSRVSISVQTSSINSGDEQRDSTLNSVDWFSTSSYPEAVFKASRFRRAGVDRYVTEGTLTIKNVTLPMTLPFSLTIKGDRATMRGSALVDRIRYRVGQGEYSSTTEIPALVMVDVAVDATRKP